MCCHGCPVLKVTVEVFHALAAMAPQVSATVWCRRVGARPRRMY